MTAHTVTAPPELADQVATIRGVFARGRTRTVEWRLRQLRGIERLLDETKKLLRRVRFADKMIGPALDGLDRVT